MGSFIKYYFEENNCEKILLNRMLSKVMLHVLNVKKNLYMASRKGCYKLNLYA